MALRVRSPPTPAAEAQERTAFAQQPAPSRSARPRGASPALQLHGRVAKLYSIDDAVARQKEAQGPRGVCWPWCSAVGFLGPHHVFATWTRRALRGRHLRSRRSLQLQEVDVFLHPPGVRVCADLPPLPGDEPVETGREVSQIQLSAPSGHPPSCSVTSIGSHRGHFPPTNPQAPEEHGYHGELKDPGRTWVLHAGFMGTSFPSLIPSTRMGSFLS